MKKIIMTIVLGITLPISVSAGQIYGSLTENGRAVRAGIKFEVTCKDRKPDWGETNGYGAYSLNVGTGKCSFKLYYGDQTPTFDLLYSYDSPLRYDFDLVQQDGKYKLRRR